MCTRKKKGRGKDTKGGQKKERREGTKKKEKNEENMRSGRRPSPEDKAAVCWYDQSYHAVYPADGPT